MRKRTFTLIFILILLLLLLIACSGGNNSETSNGGTPTNADSTPTNEQQEQTTEPTTPEPTKSEPTTTEPTTPEPTNPPDIQLNLVQFDELLAKQDMCVISTKYVIQDERYKSLYPDMLQVIIKNNTSSDIRSAVVAFVAWDSNNLPVKIKGNIDFSGGSYIKKVNYGDINLIPGATYGENSGMSIDDGLKINKFMAIVVSYETFENTTWTNPYYNAWEKALEGVKFKDNIIITIPSENSSGI